jgi:hypothetical protein
MNTLHNNQEHPFVQLSDRGAAVQSETQGEQKSCTKEDYYNVALLLLDNLLHLVLSVDKIKLAMFSTQAKAEKMGLDPDFVNLVLAQIFERSRIRREQNPLSKMF